jgi:hypothetical protein
MAHMPAYVKEFLRTLPVAWDEVKFIDGNPGEDIVLARRSGNKWYIAGINSSKTEIEAQIDLRLFNAKKATCFVNSKGSNYIDKKQVVIKPGQNNFVNMGLNDGFVMVVE